MSLPNDFPGYSKQIPGYNEQQYREKIEAKQKMHNILISFDNKKYVMLPFEAAFEAKII